MKEFDLHAKISAKVNDLLDNIVKIDPNISANARNQSYQGVQQEQVAELLYKSAECKKDVFNALKGLVPGLSAPVTGKLPDSLIGKWTYESEASQTKKIYKGNCFISNDNSDPRVIGTREVLTKKGKDRVEIKKYPWESKMIAVDKSKMLMYYTIMLDDGHYHDAIVLINLPQEPEITEMEGWFSGLAPENLWGAITFKKAP
jgi:predicted GH43/DUF377 family glycosyl hydrolase